MTSIADFAALIAGDHGLVVVSTLRADTTIQSSVVNAGVLDHPVTGAQVVGLVAQGGSAKLRNLRSRPRATVVVRAGWRWAAVEGPAELFGPDDAGPVSAPASATGATGAVCAAGAVDVRLLLRDVFAAAGGKHEDFDEYDRIMAQERRAAVLITPERIYGA